jgi:hypothetical protein
MKRFPAYSRTVSVSKTNTLIICTNIKEWLPTIRKMALYMEQLTCESRISGFMFACFVFCFTFNLLLQYA